jgi:hypothetical protein
METVVTNKHKQRRVLKINMVFFTLLYSFTIIKTLKIIVANVMRITIKWLIS